LGPAPGYGVVTVTTGKVTSGNKSTGNRKSEIIPIARIRKKIQVINMGRLIEVETIFMMGPISVI
jgi:hypothetical protein